MKKILSIVLAACLIFSVLTACGGNAPSSAGDDPITSSGNPPVADASGGLSDEFLADRIVIGCSGAGSSLAPHGRPMWGSCSVRELVFQKILRVDDTGEIHLELAKDLEKLDDLSYQITLWDNIYDSAGNHLTVNDIVYSIELYLKTGNAGGVSRLDHIEVIDDLTCIWHCNQPFGLGELERQMSNFAVVTKAAWEASSDEMVTSPVGTGPYKLASYTSGSVAVFEADENFWMKELPEDIRAGLWVYDKQNVREVECQVIKDSSSRAIALEMGTIDVADALEEIDLEAFENNSDITPVQLSNDPPVPVVFNCSSASPCADVNLRKAICYAINNQAIADMVGSGAYPIYGFQPNLYDSPEEWKTGREYYSYDADKAAELIEASGYNGEELTLLYVGSTSAAFESTAIAIQSQLKAVGIKVTLLRVDQAVNEVKRFQENEWDIRMDTYGGSDYCVQAFKSFYSATYEVALNGKTLFMVEDPKLDELYDAMSADDSNRDLLDAYDQYLTYDQCYCYGIIGYYLLSAQRAHVNVGVGDRGTMIAPAASTFN